jgi:hypothetical protein
VTKRQLYDEIGRLSPRAPVTARFEGAVARMELRRPDNWAGRQKDHWLGWLKGYRGAGYYGRKSWNVPAKTVFNRVVNPGWLLWLSEAVGIPARSLKRAADEALAAGTTMMAQSGAIRRVISWEMIEERLRK